MSTQTKNTQSVTQSNGEQITPVIIKGGGGPDAGSYAVEISGTVPFKSDFDSDPWRVSHSARRARIMSLSITDGSNNIPPLTTDVDPPLITLQVSFEQGHLHFDQEPLLELLGVGIRIDSSAEFEITERDPTDTNDWFDSTAEFSSQMTRVLFKQGDRVLIDYECQSPDVTLTVNVDSDPIG